MTNNLIQLSEEISALIKEAEKSVLRIDGRRRFPATGIVWSEEGLVITANHVLRRDNKIQVGLSNGETVEANLLGRDRSTDIALLKIEKNDLSPIPRNLDNNLSVGNIVFALARPGESVQATEGIISALGGTWRMHRRGQIDKYIQTDVLMYPGFSGGPLVSAGGQLIGMNSSSLLPGVSVALDVSTLDRTVQSLATHGKMKRGYLGVSTQRVKLPRNLREEIGQKIGLLIVSVELDSPAEAGGLTLGDTIVEMAGTSIRSHEDLVGRLSSEITGQKVPIKVIRGGEVRELNVKIGERS